MKKGENKMELYKRIFKEEQKLEATINTLDPKIVIPTIGKLLSKSKDKTRALIKLYISQNIRNEAKPFYVNTEPLLKEIKKHYVTLQTVRPSYIGKTNDLADIELSFFTYSPGEF